MDGGGCVMAVSKITKPARLKGTNATMTINTKGWTKDAAGGPVPANVATKTDIAVRFDTLSPREAFQQGHSADLTLYRLKAPVKHADGTVITLLHNQTVTIDSVEYECVGKGIPQGNSGIQIVTLVGRSV
jgi:hypothetical protein